LFCCRSRRQLVYYILSRLVCQELFFFLKEVFLSNSLSILTHHQVFVNTFLKLIIQASGEGGI
jgi:hypothetical protein